MARWLSAMDERWEMAARASARDEVRGKWPDTNSGRAKTQAHVEDHWRGIWMWMHISANWRAVFARKN